MRFIFRADASRDIGSGHVMRSSVLAEEAILRGYECIFVGEILDLNWVKDRILSMGFSKVISAESLFDIDKKSDILVLDSYTIPVSSQFVTKKNWKLVLNIRDAVTPNYESDIELRPGLIVDNSRLEYPRILSGPEHVLIRRGIGKSTRKKSLGAELKVVVVGGGSDPFGFVTAIANVIASLDLNLEVHAFSEGAIPLDSRTKFIRHSIGADLDSIAGDVDLVFTTASTSSLEFIAREIPIGVVCAIENQMEYYEQLGKLGYVSQLGFRNLDNSWEFNVVEIRQLLESYSKRAFLKDSVCGLIDLKGAARVIDTLVSLT
jgi:spore coat polysaccharide biosynthesis predicted glycosyltransferase SpsG